MLGTFKSVPPYLPKFIHCTATYVVGIMIPNVLGPLLVLPVKKPFSHASAAYDFKFKLKTIPSSTSLNNYKNNKKIHKRTKYKKQNGQILNNHNDNTESSRKNENGNGPLEHLM